LQAVDVDASRQQQVQQEGAAVEGPPAIYLLFNRTRGTEKKEKKKRNDNKNAKSNTN